MKKTIISLFALSALTACSPENPDGSDATTYSSCRITSSEAILASDRANDLNQCWDGVDYEEKNKAMAWCSQKVSNYISSNYVFGHTVRYEVASNNC
ncbi:hypothetical protein [Saccharospirillum salsuginis]|uniref:Lipoprotein n=1 Tax=Saccharospirillum salsuginis TaxID=418750 RepID=A0A918KNB5_9GAMM|nr:hypothetical protein [Saccharospirillum salsuginis]GGX68867.1 hypothetical protein GCM10007392_40650 [Saccharospirillum salsuginis]